MVKLEGELAEREEEGDAVLCSLERNKSGSSSHSAEGLIPEGRQSPRVPTCQGEGTGCSIVRRKMGLGPWSHLSGVYQLRLPHPVPVGIRQG